MFTFPFSFIKSAGGGFDTNAQAYINAVVAAGGSLSSPQQTAINQFYVDLKADGIYTKLKIMYPYLGGTAAAHAINALNPGTYTMTWNGTWTHTNSGGSYAANSGNTGGGVWTNWGDTGYDISTANADATVTNDFAWGTLMSNIQRPGALSYGYQGANTAAGQWLINGSDGNNLIENYSNAQSTISFAGISSQAGFLNAIFRNGTTVESGALQAGQPVSGGLLFGGSSTGSTYTKSATTLKLYVNKINTTGSQDGTGGNHLFDWASAYLTRAQMNVFLGRINTLQTAFGRQIFT